ncbi:Protein NRT1/ PTR FAMILY 3.1 [Ananas comosus]|uniref:Protein NRT1/ PTR FAMILY 3.1 n=1 Tax=Ananas comosus TaxID=4615 RepID=A0A199W8I2_ANACO|nr:Protein NRT1/ PTR FAMILY 3.1 [Ananas comosus]
MLSLTVSAVVPALRPRSPSAPPSPFHLLVLYASLLFTAVGSGGIRPCVVAFGADQFDLHAKPEFLDRAAIVEDGDMLDGRPQLWRVSTVHRVEEVKSIIRMLPIWSVGILLITSASHNYTFTIQQARTMDRHISPHFQIPPATLSIFSVLMMLLSLCFYDRVFVPTKRKAVAANHGLLDSPQAIVPISVFYLVPQYAIHGIADAFTSVGHMEFLYDQAPESMRSTAAALFWLAISAGNYLGTLLVTLVHEYTKKRGDWLQDNINRGKLDYYYWLVTGLQVLNLVFYVACATHYTFKPLEVVVNEEEKGGEENAKELQLLPSTKNEGNMV